MGFMDSYKRLDNLCKKRLDTSVGVTAYIDAMKPYVDNRRLTHEDKDDFYKLKHYRYIRNQIAHENHCTEDSMCKYEDTKWVDQFYVRLNNYCDPLSRLGIITRTSAKSHSKTLKKAAKHAGCFTALCFLLFAIIVCISISW